MSEEIERPAHVPGDIWDAALLPTEVIALALGEACATRRHVIRLAVASAILAERARAGGARAVRFMDKLVVVHPDMPAHVWDGEKIKMLEVA